MPRWPCASASTVPGPERGEAVRAAGHRAPGRGRGPACARGRADRRGRRRRRRGVRRRRSSPGERLERGDRDATRGEQRACARSRCARSSTSEPFTEPSNARASSLVTESTPSASATCAFPARAFTGPAASSSNATSAVTRGERDRAREPRVHAQQRRPAGTVEPTRRAIPGQLDGAARGQVETRLIEGPFDAAGDGDARLLPRARPGVGGRAASARCARRPRAARRARGACRRRARALERREWRSSPRVRARGSPSRPAPRSAWSSPGRRRRCARDGAPRSRARLPPARPGRPPGSSGSRAARDRLRRRIARSRSSSRIERRTRRRRHRLLMPKLTSNRPSLTSWGPGLARSGVGGDVVDHHASEPRLDVDPFDAYRAPERRRERGLQALARELRPPDAHGEPQAEDQDERNEPARRPRRSRDSARGEHASEKSRSSRA